MAKSLRGVTSDQPALLPVDMNEWLPATDLVRFVVAAVAQLDSWELEKQYALGGHCTIAGFRAVWG